jgi:molecular chaperone DnaJ
MKEYYQLLGVEETATDAEIKKAYNELREKYAEERWLDGERGNEAAKMLNKLDAAFEAIKTAREEQKTNTDGQNAFEKVAALLKENNVNEAQRLLDDFNERPAEWHYLQAVVFYKKNWSNDSKKQLEIAMQMEPSNAKYRDAYNKLTAKNNTANGAQGNAQGNENYRQNPYSSAPREDYDSQQMGGSVCSNCASFCATYLCVDCLFSMCCGCQ